MVQTRARDRRIRDVGAPEGVERRRPENSSQAKVSRGSQFEKLMSALGFRRPSKDKIPPH